MNGVVVEIITPFDERRTTILTDCNGQPRYPAYFQLFTHPAWTVQVRYAARHSAREVAR